MMNAHLQSFFVCLCTGNIAISCYHQIDKGSLVSMGMHTSLGFRSSKPNSGYKLTFEARQTTSIPGTSKATKRLTNITLRGYTLQARTQLSPSKSSDSNDRTPSCSGDKT
jgi:hypothetical protein